MCRHSWALALGLSIFHATLGLAQADEILVGTGEFPPYTTDTTADQGCVIKIVRSAFEAEGWTVKAQFMPWPRNRAMLSRGQIDASAYWMDRPDRRENFIFPKNPVTSEVYRFVSRADSKVPWETYEDLSGKNIIINNGYTYTDEFYDALEKFDIQHQKVTSEDMNLMMVLRGRGDLTIVSEKVFEKYANELSDEQKSQLYVDSKPALVNRGFLLFSREISRENGEASQNMARVFDSGYAKIRDREDLQQHFETCGFLRAGE